jgi:DNA repair exonuclease SbcCD nuclease subunit
MIKILHSADWHLGSPLLQKASLKTALMGVPEQIAALCKQENCDMMLLSGDLFDGIPSADTVQAVRNALEGASVPVFISPGNHDFVSPGSPWLTESWPENVHIFTHPVMEAVDVPHLNCCVYGAGFLSMDCPGLLEDFSPTHTEKYAVGVLHGDPTQLSSPYCPITSEQVSQSKLHYLALGHIHKGDSFHAGSTLCAWPGCPMGRGYDETGEKGVLIVTVDETANARFVPLNVPKFFDLAVDVNTSLDTVLPPLGNEDYYRITLVGTGEKPNLEALQQGYSRFPNLVLRDRSSLPVDIWSSAGEDTLEGKYFQLLRNALEQADENTQRKLHIAAEISRKLLDGQEVVLP